MDEIGNLAIAAEDIKAGSPVYFMAESNHVFGDIPGKYIGHTIEQIREGFRISVKDREVREDDA